MGTYVAGIRRQGERRAAAVLLLSILPLAGCYRAVPLEVLEPEPGARIVAQLTEEGSDEMARWVGPGVVAVEGIAGVVQPDEWELQLISVQYRSGTETFWNREPVRFPRGALASVQERRLDRPRTYLAAAGLTVAVVALGRAFGTGAVFGGSGGGGDSPAH